MTVVIRHASIRVRECNYSWKGPLSASLVVEMKTCSDWRDMQPVV
jgi:hypothetical protein